MARTSSLRKNTGKYPQIGENIRKVMLEVVGKKHSLEFYNLVFPGKNITDNAKRNKINLLLNGHIELKDLIAISRATGKSLNTLVYGRKKGGQQQAPGEELTIREYARLLLHLIEITGSKVETNEGGGVKIVFDERAPMLPFEKRNIANNGDSYSYTAWQLSRFLSHIADIQEMENILVVGKDVSTQVAFHTVSNLKSLVSKSKKEFMEGLPDITPETAFMEEKRKLEKGIDTEYDTATTIERALEKTRKVLK